MGLYAGHLQSGAFLTSGPHWERSRRCAALGADFMAMLSIAASPFCRPEEDPFLLLESTFRALEEILRRRRGLPLRRTWIDLPYGEEEITLLEEKVLPALKSCLLRIQEIDEWILVDQELLQRCSLEADRDALRQLRPVMG
jgi:hypothetical protein